MFDHHLDVIHRYLGCLQVIIVKVGVGHMDGLDNGFNRRKKTSGDGEVAILGRPKQRWENRDAPLEEGGQGAPECC